MIRRVRKSFRSGVRRIPFLVASSSNVIKILIQQARVAYHTQLNISGNRVEPHQRPTVGTHDLALWLNRRICTKVFLVSLVLAQTHPPLLDLTVSGQS
jgi:hypothetical protein